MFLLTAQPPLLATSILEDKTAMAVPSVPLHSLNCLNYVDFVNWLVALSSSLKYDYELLYANLSVQNAIVFLKCLWNGLYLRSHINQSKQEEAWTEVAKIREYDKELRSKVTKLRRYGI